MAINAPCIAPAPGVGCTRPNEALTLPPRNRQMTGIASNKWNHGEICGVDPNNEMAIWLPVVSVVVEFKPTGAFIEKKNKFKAYNGPCAIVKSVSVAQSPLKKLLRVPRCEKSVDE